jgi:hypothetical protein
LKEKFQEDEECSGRSLHFAGLSPALHSLYLRIFVHTVLNNCVSSQSGKYIQRASCCAWYTCAADIMMSKYFLLPNVTQGLLCVQEAGAYACETCLEFDLTNCSPERPCCIHADNTSTFCFFCPTPESRLVNSPSVFFLMSMVLQMMVELGQLRVCRTPFVARKSQDWQKSKCKYILSRFRRVHGKHDAKKDLLSHRVSCQVRGRLVPY